MLKSSLISATCVAVFFVGALAQSAYAGPGGGPAGDGFGVTRDSGGSLLSIVDPTREDDAANFVFTLFGDQNDTLVVGDWNGDGNQTLGLARVDNGALLWILDFTGNGSLVYDLFGSEDDIPVVGDWDPISPGDEIGFARPDIGSNTLEWILKDNNPGTGFSREFFGLATDVPVPGNWDSDASNGDELGVARADSTALLWITQGSGGFDYNLFGDSGDTPVQGDYTGDGNTNFGFSPPGSNVFTLDGASIEFHVFGDTTDDAFRSGTFGQPSPP